MSVIWLVSGTWGNTWLHASFVILHLTSHVQMLTILVGIRLLQDPFSLGFSPQLSPVSNHKTNHIPSYHHQREKGVTVLGLWPFLFLMVRWVDIIILIFRIIIMLSVGVVTIWTNVTLIVPGVMHSHDSKIILTDVWMLLGILLGVTGTLWPLSASSSSKPMNHCRWIWTVVSKVTNVISKVQNALECCKTVQKLAACEHPLSWNCIHLFTTNNKFESNWTIALFLIKTHWGQRYHFQKLHWVKTRLGSVVLTNHVNLVGVRACEQVPGGSLSSWLATHPRAQKA